MPYLILQVSTLARKDWWYLQLPIEMAETLEEIVKREGNKYGIFDKQALGRYIIADFVMKYEANKGIVATRKAVRQPGGKDVQRPPDG